MPPRIASVVLDRQEPAWSRSAVRAVRRLTQLRCGVVPGRDSSSSAGSGRRVPSLHSSVRLRRGYTCLLFLHTSAGMNPAGSVPGRQEAAVPAAGADIVSLVHSYAVPQTAKDCAGAAVPGPRRERTTFDPAMGRPGPGPGGGLPPLRAGLFRCSREPVVSLPRRSRARRPHPFQTASGATLHSLRSFRALWHWQTHSRRTRPPPQFPRLRDCQHHRPTQDARPKVSAISTVLPRPDGRKGCIYIKQEAAAQAAAGDVND